MTPISSMAVTVTLVFSDELHREAWLVQQGIIAPESPLKVADDYELPSDRQEQKLCARRIDYDRRRKNTDLQYTVGPLPGVYHPGSSTG